MKRTRSLATGQEKEERALITLQKATSSILTPEEPSGRFVVVSRWAQRDLPWEHVASSRSIPTHRRASQSHVPVGRLGFIELATNVVTLEDYFKTNGVDQYSVCP